MCVSYKILRVCDTTDTRKIIDTPLRCSIILVCYIGGVGVGVALWQPAVHGVAYWASHSCAGADTSANKKSVLGTYSCNISVYVVVVVVVLLLLCC